MTMPSLVAMASRFPLMPRARPPARPIDARTARLTGLATSAHANHDPDQASTAFNGAALLASDCGDHGLAARWCRWHANLYLTRPRLDAHSSRFALEPLVNLARLHTRAHDGDGAYQLLTDLHHAVTQQGATTIDGVDLRTDLWDTAVASQPELHDWLRRVLLADGTRALVAAGRWREAVNHASRHGGISAQLHEGRQVAILAALIEGNSTTATDIVLASIPDETWQHAIQAVLLALCRPAEVNDEQRRALLKIARDQELAPGNGLAVYRTRLGLTTADMAGPGLGVEAQRLCARLCADALADQDGHAVVDLLNHPLVSLSHHHDLRGFLDSCGLQRGELPCTQRTQLQEALLLAAQVIESPGRPATG